MHLNHATLRANLRQYQRKYRKRQAILRGVLKAHRHLIPEDISRRCKPMKSAHEMPPNPYRRSKGSLYSVVWSVLYRHREQGISRWELLRQVEQVAKQRTAQQIKWAISIVASVNEFGECHRSAHPDGYWVEKHNDWLRLHLRNDHGTTR